MICYYCYFAYREKQAASQALWQIPAYSFHPTHFSFPAIEEQLKCRVYFVMVPGDCEQCVKLLSCQQTCTLWGHKRQDQAQCKFKELFVLKLTWESSIKTSKVQTSNCLHVCFPCEPTIPIWNFSLDSIQAFSGIKCSGDKTFMEGLQFYTLIL